VPPPERHLACTEYGRRCIQQRQNPTMNVFTTRNRRSPFWNLKNTPYMDSLLFYSPLCLFRPFDNRLFVGIYILFWRKIFIKLTSERCFKIGLPTFQRVLYRVINFRAFCALRASAITLSLLSYTPFRVFNVFFVFYFENFTRKNR
jgi:hypothetical protein